MGKQSIRPYVLILMTVIIIAGLVAGSSSASKMTAQATSVELRAARDGTVYELISLGSNSLCLRKISPEGRVTGYFPLPIAGQRGMFASYHMVGLIDSELYLYYYQSPGDRPERYDEAIIAYDMSDGTRRIVAETPSPPGLDKHRIFYAADAAGSGVFLGYLDGSRLTIRRVDTVSGAMADQFSAEIGFHMSSFTVTPQGELYVLAADSRVFRLEGQAWVRVFQPAPREAIASLSPGPNGSVYMFSIYAGVPRVRVTDYGESRFYTFDINADSFVRINITAADNWAAIDRDSNYIVSTDGVQRVITDLKPLFPLVFDSAALLAVTIVAAAAGAVLFTVRLVLQRRRLRLLVKLLLILIPVFSLGIIILVSVAASYVSQVIENDIFESILKYADDAAAVIDTQKLAMINWNDPYIDEYYLSVRQDITDRSRYRLLSMGEGASQTVHNAYASHWLYRVDGNRIYTAVCGNIVVGLQTPYFEYEQESPARDAMLASKKPVKAYLGGTDSDMRWLAVFYPLAYQDEVIGYIEVAQPLNAIDAEVYGVTTEIIKAGFVVFALVLMVLICVLVLSTRTLDKLKRGALAVSGGDYSARVVTRSWDETGEIAAAFNKMSQSVETYVEEVSLISDGYSRFVSGKLIELLGKESINQVYQGDYATLTATHLLMSTDGFDTAHGEIFFQELGKFYCAVIPGIEQNGGLITGYSARGFTAIFESLPEVTVRAMIAAYQALDRLGENFHCSAFIGYSGAMLGVTGTGSHLNMITVSRLVHQANAVGMAGIHFGARLIIAQSAFEAMGNAVKRYRQRFLGVMKTDGAESRLYDFYDCDTPEIRRNKDETKEMFEQGVRLYYSGDYARARLVFIDIIKVFPQDIASREYLLRSHLGQQSGGEPMLFLELK